MLYKFALAGATGQIGRLLKRELGKYGGGVKVLTREDMDVPDGCQHVVNAAGYTKFNDKVERYWHDNIRLALDLVIAAQRVGAQYHQLSSEAVAEYRTDPLRESLFNPRAHPSMNDYALSKLLVEKTVLSVIKSGHLSIYRCSDVVPSITTFKTQWRADHWLSIMFAAGQGAFEVRDDFPIWIATVQQMAQALAILIAEDQVNYGVYHLLGTRVLWSTLYDAASAIDSSAFMGLAKQVRPIIRIDPPLADCIVQRETEELLKGIGFHWKPLTSNYWEEFSQQATERML